MSVVPQGLALFGGSLSATERSFCLFFCLEKAIDNPEATIRFTEDNFERNLQLNILIPFPRKNLLILLFFSSSSTGSASLMANRWLIPFKYPQPQNLTKHHLYQASIGIYYRRCQERAIICSVCLSVCLPLDRVEIIERMSECFESNCFQ